MSLKILFRGDTRTPNGPDNMFTGGFQRRMVGAGPIQYRDGANAAGDIEPSTAVCLSARISGAAMFPLRFTIADPAVSDTYIYMVALDDQQLTNTHGKQVNDGLAGVTSGNAAHNALWPLFAHELAVMSVQPGDIIAAVRCTRTWNGNDWTTGANYQLHYPIYLNPGCAVTATMRNPALTFLNGELANHAAGATPAMNTGYVASTRR